MKPIYLWVILLTCFFAMSLPCYAELTKEEVRQIIREEIEPLKLDIVEMKVTIKEMDKRMTAQFSAVDYRFTILQWFITGLIAITVAAIAIPQLLIAYREGKESRLAKELDEIKQRIVELEKKKIVI